VNVDHYLSPPPGRRGWHSKVNPPGLWTRNPPGEKCFSFNGLFILCSVYYFRRMEGITYGPDQGRI
jgi:hypothetical protein